MKISNLIRSKTGTKENFIKNETTKKNSFYSRFHPISKNKVKDKIGLAFRKVPTILNCIAIPLSIIDITGVTSCILKIIADAGSLAFAAKDLHTHRRWTKEIVIEEENTENNQIHNLKTAVKKIHSLHRKFLVFDVVSSSIETGLTLGCGVTKVGIKIAMLAGGLSSPIATAIDLPFTIIPIAAKIAHIGVRRVLVVAYKPSTTKEMLHGTEVKILYNKGCLKYHRFTLKAQQRFDKWQKNYIGSLEAKLEKLEAGDEDERRKIRSKIDQAQTRNTELLAKTEKNQRKIEQTSIHIGELKDRIIEAGWKDVQRYTKIEDCDIYAQALINLYDREEGLDEETDNFLKRHMGINLKAVYDSAPENLEVEALSREIKKFFIKDEQEMVSFIQKQRRDAKKTA